MPAVLNSSARARLLKDTLGRALRSPTESGVRSFMLDGLSCTVEWRPGPGGAMHQVRISLRRGEKRMDHGTSIADLSSLPRTCEQVLLAFDKLPTTSGAPQLAVAGRR